MDEDDDEEERYDYVAGPGQSVALCSLWTDPDGNSDPKLMTSKGPSMMDGRWRRVGIGSTTRSHTDEILARRVAPSWHGCGMSGWKTKIARPKGRRGLGWNGRMAPGEQRLTTELAVDCTAHWTDKAPSVLSDDRSGLACRLSDCCQG
ncbi:hypothetical protein PR001_g12009 [Phytophthora rubi]|uniref:Uncharacterized protein n=1 Tax=Phytophthora rubi TaxID=129364 RepID=A0A6A3M5R9_9STRA|nr:hypothetical protein PR001_g12009 [Phytophthora rubi]